MVPINCETNIILTWSENRVISSATGLKKFAITDTKLYTPIATLSSQANIKLLKQLESSFKIITNWNKHQSKVTGKAKNR